MKKIESFTVNHLKLDSGLYVSRKDSKNGQMVTTFDLRFTAPNKEPVMDVSSIHTIEHLGATFFRNSNIKEDVIYFGPMGCRTGFYLVLFGDLTSNNVYQSVCDMCEFILQFSGDIPGASPIECGNYSDQDLIGAKKHVEEYYKRLTKYKNFTYSE